MQELSYLSQVIYEALRFMPPAATSSQLWLSEDAKVGDYLIRAGDKITLNMRGLHRNASQWQRPDEFLPERFDNSHPLSLTPKGGKRLPTSWLAFHGGKRICFGKTFAEANVRVATTYLSQYFDFEFVEKELYPDSNNLPLLHVAQNYFPKVLVTFTLRRK